MLNQIRAILAHARGEFLHIRTDHPHWRDWFLFPFPSAIIQDLRLGFLFIRLILGRLLRDERRGAIEAEA